MFRNQSPHTVRRKARAQGPESNRDIIQRAASWCVPGSRRMEHPCFAVPRVLGGKLDPRQHGACSWSLRVGLVHSPETLRLIQGGDSSTAIALSRAGRHAHPVHLTECVGQVDAVIRCAKRGWFLRCRAQVAERSDPWVRRASRTPDVRATRPCTFPAIEMRGA